MIIIREVLILSFFRRRVCEVLKNSRCYALHNNAFRLSKPINLSPNFAPSVLPTARQRCVHTIKVETTPECLNNVCRGYARVSHAGTAVGPSGAPERRRRCFLAFSTSSAEAVRTTNPAWVTVAPCVIARAGDTPRAFVSINAKYNSRRGCSLTLPRSLILSHALKEPEKKYLTFCSQQKVIFIRYAVM